MSWRENELARGALAEQGYFDEETSTLSRDTLAVALREVFFKAPVRSARVDVLEKKNKFFQTGLTKEQLLDRILPGFQERYALNDEERLLLKKSAKDHPDLEERDSAINDASNLLWGTMSKTSRAGAVQALLVQKGLLLCEAKATRDNATVSVKAATDDHDLIIDFYVRPRGDQLVRVSGGVRDDCTMVGVTFEGISERMKRELGMHVTTAVSNLLQVASPDLAALDMQPTRNAKAISSVPAKG
jgi:hypothetical protein